MTDPVQDPAPVQPPTNGAAAPESDEQWAQGATAQLQAFFDAQPEAPELIDRVIGEHMLEDIDTETGGEIHTDLALFMGSENADFLMTALARGVEDPEFFALVLAHVDAELSSILRAWLSLHGVKLREAYLLGGENPNGWRTINREVFFEVITGKWGVSFEIIKRNGDVFKLEEDPASMLVLGQAILDTLLSLPPDSAPDLFDRQSLETLVQTVSDFLNMAAPDEEDAAPDEEDAAPGAEGEQGAG